METQKLVVQSKDDIIKFINSNPVSRGGFKVILVALGGVFVDAYDVVSLGIGTDQLVEQFNLSPSMLGMLHAIMAIGALLGGVLGGYYTDKFGRNKMFMIDMFFMVFAALGAALSPNLASLVVFRFLMGIGIGMDLPIALSFIAEYSNRQKKGQFVNLWQAIWYVAAVATGLIILPFYLLGAEDHVWRWAVGFGAVAALVVLIFRYMFMHESPMWAATHLPLRDAAKVVEKTYKISIVVENDMEETISKKSKPYSVLFTPKYRARTILVSILTATQAMQYFAVGFYIPTISAMIFGKGMVNSISGTIFFNLFGIIGGFCASHFASKHGIRNLALTGYLIVIISLVSIGVSGGSMPVVLSTLSLALFIFGHSVGPGAQSKTMGTLSYPTDLRGLGTGLAEGSSRVGNMIGLFLFPVILSALGLAHTLLLLSIVPLIGFVGLLLIKWDPTRANVEIE